jgi:hypothetical protein
MKRNAGGIDRTIRVIAGLALLSLLFWGEGSARWWGVIGLIPLFTGLAGSCPAYTLLGISTCPLKGSEKS